jgi:hypothetical protein
MFDKVPLFKSRNLKQIWILGIQNGLAGFILVVSVAILYRSWILPYPPVGYVAFMHYFSLALEVSGIFFVVYFTIIGIAKNGIYSGFERGKYFVASVMLILISYAIVWHLAYNYYEYKWVYFQLLIAVVAVVQGSIWAKDSDKKICNQKYERNANPWLSLIIGVSFIFLLIGTIVSIRNVRFEDVFITFRYGWNLAQGNGINWNVSDPIPAEGYTTFSFVLLSALFYTININPLIGTQVINILVVCLAGYLIWQIGRELFRDKRGIISLLPVTMFIAFPATVFHIATGMETLFFAASLLGISLLAIKWINLSHNNLWFILLLGLTIFISGLTRPEGFVYGLVTLCLMTFIARRKFLHLESLVVLCISLLIPGLIYFIWRLSYFKNLFPLSFYHKSSVGDLYAHAARSVLFTDFVGMVLIAFIGIILYRLLTRSFNVSAYLLLIPSTLMVLFYSRILAVAGLQYRFFFPYACAFFILASDDLADYFGMITSKTGILPGSLISTILFLYILLGPFFYETRNTIEFFIDGRTYNEETDGYMNIGKAFLNIDESESIGIGEVGKIGLLLKNYTVVDVVGLNDVYLARNPFSTEYLDKRGVNILITYPYPGAPIHIFSDVYRKLGESFGDIQSKFTCVGNIEGLDVFIRSKPSSLLEKYIEQLRNSEHFKEGVCLSITTP